MDLENVSKSWFIPRSEQYTPFLWMDAPIALLEQENYPIRRLCNEIAKYVISLEQGNFADNGIYRQIISLSQKMLSDSFDEQQIPLMLREFMSAIDN